MEGQGWGAAGRSPLNLSPRNNIKFPLCPSRLNDISFIDVVDWIVNNLIDNTRTRRSVLLKLKEMCLLTDNYKDGKKSGARKAIPQSWGAEEEARLRELHEEFKDAVGECLKVEFAISR